MRYTRALNVALILCLCGTGISASARPSDSSAAKRGHEKNKPVRLALIGDMPYRDEDIPKFDEVLREINEASVDFTIHTGDIKSGGSLCSDELLQDRYDQLAQLRCPLVYTPGDNEWTDCHREAAGQFNPNERLAKIRAMFFPKPGRTLGKHPMVVQTQADDASYAEFVENVRFMMGDVVFATIHVVGSHNGRSLWDGIGETEADLRQERVEEVQRRTAAVMAWIDQTFDLAEKRGAGAVLLAMQANPNFEAEEGSDSRDGFDEIINKIAARTIAFARPVMVAHGDSHYMRFDKPLRTAVGDLGQRRLEDFTRAENFGDTDVHWVELVVDTKTHDVFCFVQHIVEANRFER